MAITGKGLEEPLARIWGIFALTDGSRPKAAAHAVTLSVGYAAVAVLGKGVEQAFDIACTSSCKQAGSLI